jgi:hypothetical protein
MSISRQLSGNQPTFTPKDCEPKIATTLTDKTFAGVLFARMVGNRE